MITLLTKGAATKVGAFALAGATAGAGVLALSPSNASAGSGTTTQQQRLHIARFLARHVQHADWTTRNGKHHAEIQGTVKLLSSHTVTIRAKDGRYETWKITKDTKVRVLGDGHRGQDPFSHVKVGEHAWVVGSGSHDARLLVARQAKPATSSGSSPAPSQGSSATAS